MTLEVIRLAARLARSTRAVAVQALAAAAIAATVLSPGAGRAAPALFHPVALAHRPAVRVRVPYTLGTHEQQVAAVRGALRLDPETLTSDGGRLVVPIAAIASDSPDRDCHLQEAIGLDYSFSRFPREHVCDDAHRLPGSGPDAVAFPEVTLEVRSARPRAAAARGDEVPLDVVGTWTIRGASRPAHLALAVARAPDASGALRVRGRATFRLDDYGIVVKSARALFVTIAVGEVVTADIDVLIAPSTTGASGAPGAG